MQKLLDVQKVDLQIQDLERESAAIPLQMQEKDNALSFLKAELKKLKDELEEKRKEQRHLERQLDQKQQELGRFNAQLPLIKTNREYKAILVEIDSVEKTIADLEEHVLGKMSEVEEIEAKTQAKETEIGEAQSEIDKEKQRLREKQKALELSLQGSRCERETLVTGVDDSLLSQYDKIRVHKGGLAIALLQDESCGACHMALPPQLVNEVIGGVIRSCPSCSRLLYWNETWPEEI